MAISRMSLVQVLHKLGVEQDPNFDATVIVVEHYRQRWK